MTSISRRSDQICISSKCAINKLKKCTHKHIISIS